MGIILAEHQSCKIQYSEEEDSGSYNRACFTLSLKKADYETLEMVKPRTFKISRGKKQNCFDFNKEENNFIIRAGYYIGVDWLFPNGRYLQVEPKLNLFDATCFNTILELENPEDELVTDILDKKIKIDLEESVKEINNYREVNYLRMLLDAMTDESVSHETDGLVFIDWDSPELNIKQNSDQLTPFLVVHFLNLLKTIVRKGLKKSYYKVQEHLNNRVKGKVLVSQQIKQNILKNRVTKTYCEYQLFGVDHIENRFLKTVLSFTIKYVENHAGMFGSNIGKIKSLLTYVHPAFEQVSLLESDEQLRHFKHNPFFKEYRNAIKTGKYILKRFAYNLSQTAAEFNTIPPFWIDTPRLFELYVYQKLLTHNPLDHQHIHYQFSTYGNSLDYLISKPGFEMVIDAKYKMKYSSSLVHEDIRQVAGYARLNKVLRKLNIVDQNNELIKDENAAIDCLIIYPDLKADIDFDLTFENIRTAKSRLKAYHNVFKIGLSLPLI